MHFFSNDIFETLHIYLLWVDVWKCEIKIGCPRLYLKFIIFQRWAENLNFGYVFFHLFNPHYIRRTPNNDFLTFLPQYITILNPKNINLVGIFICAEDARECIITLPYVIHLSYNSIISLHIYPSMISYLTIYIQSNHSICIHYLYL